MHRYTASRVAAEEKYLVSEDAAHDLEPPKASGVRQR